MQGESKVQALRLKEMAEERIHNQDYINASTLIEEAQKCFPGLDHASNMLTACRILCSAIELPGYGFDWYIVLQLLPSDDTAIIETRYKELISELEPIMNEFPGTYLALKFVQEAFSVLSDPVKREAFDLKSSNIGNISESNYKGQYSGVVEGTKVANVGGNFSSGSSDLPGSSKRSAPEAFGSRCSKSLVEGYFDGKKKICGGEASRDTAEIRPEADAGIPTVLFNLEGNPSVPPQPCLQKSSNYDFYDFDNNRKAQLFSHGQVWVAYDQEGFPRCYARIDRIVHHEFKLHVTWFKPFPESLDEKRWCDAGLPVVCGSFILGPNKDTQCGFMMFSHYFSKRIAKRTLEIYPRKGEVWAVYRDWDMEWCSDPLIRKCSGYELVEILTDCKNDSGVSVVQLEKIDGFSNVYARKRGSELSIQIPFGKRFMFSHNVPVYRFVGGEIRGVSKGMLELDPLAVPGDVVQESPVASRSSDEVKRIDEASFSHLADVNTNTVDTAGSSLGSQNINNWSAKDFAAEHVWAVYDGPYAMPRRYVKIISVVSLTKVSVAFLEPHPMLDEEIQWLEEGLPFVCGIFRVGKATSVLDMCKFSHLVNCEWSSRKSFYRIFPREGEIWAVFKNWNMSWKAADINGYDCWIVEVLSDFSEKDGIRIGNLTVVDGYLTFFQRQMHEEFQLTRRLSRLEMLSFSHRIPAFTVVGIKDCRIPEGTLHLEPNALPLKSSD